MNICGSVIIRTITAGPKSYIFKIELSADKRIREYNETCIIYLQDIAKHGLNVSAYIETLDMHNFGRVVWS